MSNISEAVEPLNSASTISRLKAEAGAKFRDERAELLVQLSEFDREQAKRAGKSHLVAITKRKS